MEPSGRGANFRRLNGQTPHQQMAGLASFLSFSAHWRAWQGLPLLHPADVVYLTPADFCGPLGKPLSPARQRRVFRQYVAAAAQIPLSALRASALASAGRGGRGAGAYQGGDLAFVRLAACWARAEPRGEVVYGGRQDIGRYESEALRPTRPYTVPVASRAFPAFWCEAGAEREYEEW